jgi:hypothetical protein
MIGYKLTIEQAKELTGKQYAPNCYFNPVKDINDVYFIFQQEVEQSDIAWVKDLPLIEFEPKIIDLPNV